LSFGDLEIQDSIKKDLENMLLHSWKERCLIGWWEAWPAQGEEVVGTPPKVLASLEIDPRFHSPWLWPLSMLYDGGVNANPNAKLKPKAKAKANLSRKSLSVFFGDT